MMIIKSANGNTLKELLKTLISVIEEKDKYLKGHSERVATLCVRFSGKLGLPKQDLEKIYLAGLLHDIGMVYIPLEITQKSGKLTEDEMQVMKQHPIISEKILSKNGVFQDILPVIRHHHEAIDGSGYPDGLKRGELSFETRILSLVNFYEAMVSARSHRSSLSREEALDKIKAKTGGMFEQDLVEAFVEFFKASADSQVENKETRGDETVRDIVLGIVKKATAGEIDLPVLPKIVQSIQNVMSQRASASRK